jgi:hypothetical protein
MGARSPLFRWRLCHGGRWRLWASAIHARAVIRDTPHSRAAAEANLTIADIRQSGGLSRCRTAPVVVELIAKSDVESLNSSSYLENN